jgi:hypothetical protein
MPTISRTVLATKPKYLRAPKAKGGVPSVDRAGGFRKQGVIRGASIVTRGEALGHGLWLDQEFVQSVADGINQRAGGVKARFTHPGLSSDGLGTFLGRSLAARTGDNQALADLHFSKAGHSTPDGDLASYVMDLAQDDPDTFGVSIVFEPNLEAEKAHFTQHGGKIKEHDDGCIEWDTTDFQSPDPDNAQNLPHARLASLRATDVVDEPAANPDGLFHREQRFAQEATSVAAYALGLTSERPQLMALGLDADRVAGFVKRFLHDNKLEVVKMADEPKPADDTEPIPAAESDEAKPEDQESADAAAPTEPRTQGARFVKAFGDKGARWFIEGKSFEDCLHLHSEVQQQELAAVRQENEQLKQRLAANPSAGEKSPIGFTSDEPGQKRRGLSSRIRFAGAKN